MYIGEMNSCCGIGEICNLDEELVELEQGYRIEHVFNDRWENVKTEYSLEHGLEKLIKLRDGTHYNRPYSVIVATTPNKEEWAPIHWILSLADFVPVAEGRTQHAGHYTNILWIFQRKVK